MAPGNQLTTYLWDGENRSIQVALPSGIVDTFMYNGDGQRVQKQGSAGTTKHIWDRENILLETDGSNSIQVVYTLEPGTHGDLISQRRSGSTSFYLFDVIGSTRGLTDISADIQNLYIYDSFGTRLFTSGSQVTPFTFIGRHGYYWDSDISLYYIRLRI